MIFVTLGTIPYPFDRSIEWIQKLLEKEIITEPVFIQHGATDISDIQNHHLITAAPLLTGEELNEKVKQARLVISHAGQGSTRKLAAQSTSFVILPRLAKYNEHIDDHQMRFSEGVCELGVKVCSDFDSLRMAIVNPPEPLNRDLFPGPKLGDFLAQKYNSFRVKQVSDTSERLSVRTE